jgi:hypothetical protein
LHSPLPLPFYAKSLGIYGDFIRQQYRSVPMDQFLGFIRSFMLLFVIIVLRVIIDLKNRRFDTSALNKGLLAATCLFFCFYLFFVLQVGYYEQRFYYPTFPAIAFVAASDGNWLIRRFRSMVPSFIRKYREPIQFCFFLTVCCLAICLTESCFRQSAYWIGQNKGSLFRFNVREEYATGWSSTYWVCLDRFSTLPDDLTLATTEVGRPAALNPRKRVIDLAGLNETDFAHQRFSADVFFGKYQPDLIYIPHPHYKEMIEQIIRHPYFVSHYDYFHGPALFMGIALRRDGKYYQDMRRMLMQCMDSVKMK